MFSEALIAILRQLYPIARSGAHALGLRASKYPRLVVLANAIRDPYEQSTEFDRKYATLLDPWGYTTKPSERERYRLAVEMLKQARGGNLGRVLEIGCAEGVFTELLAPLCDSLVAVDFSEIALQHARARRDWGNRVSFIRWDLRADPVAEDCDVIVAMDVLPYVRRFGEPKRIRDKLTSALHTGALLLVSVWHEYESIEHTYFAKYFDFGAKRVMEGLAVHPGFAVVSRAATENHSLALFRKM